MHEVRRILAEQTALAESLANEPHPRLLEIAETAVDQLGAAAGGALAEVVLFQEHDAIAARSRIDRDSDTGRAAADYRDIPRSIGAFNSFELPRAIAVSEHGYLDGSFVLGPAFGMLDRFLPARSHRHRVALRD